MLVFIFADNLPRSVFAISIVRAPLRTGTYSFVPKLFSCYVLSFLWKSLDALFCLSCVYVCVLLWLFAFSLNISYDKISGLSLFLQRGNNNCLDFTTVPFTCISLDFWESSNCEKSYKIKYPSNWGPQRRFFNSRLRGTPILLIIIILIIIIMFTFTSYLHNRQLCVFLPK